MEESVMKRIAEIVCSNCGHPASLELVRARGAAKTGHRFVNCRELGGNCDNASFSVRAREVAKLETELAKLRHPP